MTPPAAWRVEAWLFNFHALWMKARWRVYYAKTKPRRSRAGEIFMAAAALGAFGGPR